ncbi:UDP-N-acetylglucosamine--N-acetylmuramyl-(pentapeptide) pyrophosphoryl-undecaprenol N-acetylglucosamine transferase [hydrothermal vent metagenome]|uniref:UDP-N-acetylglucosamine--N-acetylmuramyl-(Pentapeptide) pyrophosphoryl-undecaprenol N-acetylglucosamine transferase n=1 Tax=hydrothermal vent metagenome TaxID=652676 RepID=A0A3B0WGK7_9ZZZZ
MIDVRPVLIMAGGTGGHVFPALAVADELRSRGIPVVWLGTKAGIESRLIPQAGYPIEWMSITGLRGKNALTLLLAPIRIIMACWQALNVLLKRKPCAVLGMGGFASGPGGLMAWLIRKPLIVHEQNAIAGMTNKILAKFADVVLQAFPKVFKNAEITGNPVRQLICEIKNPEARFTQQIAQQVAQQAPRNLRLLVIGGSLGAVKLNEIIPSSLAKINKEQRPEIIHQTGLKNIEAAKNLYNAVKVEAKIEAFIDDMPAVYEWADLVICRSGAMTVFELAAAGIASILVPYPHAVDDHQTQNAYYLEKNGAAIIKQQNELTTDWLVEKINNFSADRKKLLDMAIAARKLAVPDSAKTIADACLHAGGIA